MVEDKNVRIEQFGLTADSLRLIREVFRNHPEVHRVAVFGSRAMGRFQPWSDIDLALWGDVDQVLIGRVMRELDELPLPYNFDVQAYLSIKHESLRRHIDEVGRILYPAEASSAS